MNITPNINSAIKHYSWQTIALHGAVWLGILISFIGMQTFNGASPSLLRTMVVMVCAVGGYYGNTLFLVNRYFETKHYLAYTTIVVSIIILSTALNYAAESLFLGGEMWHKFFVEPRRFIVAVLWVSVTITLVGLLTTTQRNRRRSESETQELLLRHNEAQMQFLRAQINPHFLFNTLNNIYSLAVVQSPQTAPMIMRLSRLLRYSIYTTQKPSVSIQEEIAEIHELIALFQLRSEEPMNITFTAGGEIHGRQIEPMILFALMENCLKHSDITHNTAGFIAIHLAVEGETVYFSTLNTKDNSNAQKDAVGGVGLHNIRQRLALKYADRAALAIHDTETHFEARLTIPVLL
ncbi:MAG: sensor histidine kinase [Candidatus Kapabacteria bacterium]|nr:sensor histidine kinase [Candidatus Kapabacteria bacterium]